MAQEKKKSEIIETELPYLNISGSYNNNGTIISYSSDGKIKIKLGSTKRPDANGRYNPPSLVGTGIVNFPDDKTYSFIFTGTQIKWTNNTTWKKDTIDATYKDESNNSITITSSSDGELIIKWTSISRPDAYGNINVNSGTGWARFPDDNKFNFTFNGLKINWSNNTIWIKQK